MIAFITSLLLVSSVALGLILDTGQALPDRRSNSLEPHSPRAVAATYHSCTSAQIASIYNAVGETMSYTRDSYRYTSDITAAASDRFTTWFGKDSASFFNSTTSRYAAIVANMKTLSEFDLTKLTYDCGTCVRDDVYGRVFIQQPSIVYLCKPFWKAPLTGSNSQAGNLLGLVAQIRDAAGLSTFATERLICEKLAIDSPNLAVQNAASYQFFAENTPAL